MAPLQTHPYPVGPAAQIIEWVMSLFHRAVLRVLCALVYKPSAKSQIGKLSVCVFMKVGYPSLGLSAHNKSDIVQCSLCGAMHPVTNLWMSSTVVTKYYYSKHDLHIPSRFNSFAPHFRFELTTKHSKGGFRETPAMCCHDNPLLANLTKQNSQTNTE